MFCFEKGSSTGQDRYSAIFVGRRKTSTRESSQKPRSPWLHCSLFSIQCQSLVCVVVLWLETGKEVSEYVWCLWEYGYLSLCSVVLVVWHVCGIMVARCPMGLGLFAGCVAPGQLLGQVPRALCLLLFVFYLFLVLHCCLYSCHCLSQFGWFCAIGGVVLVGVVCSLLCFDCRLVVFEAFCFGRGLSVLLDVLVSFVAAVLF